MLNINRSRNLGVLLVVWVYIAPINTYALSLKQSLSMAVANDPVLQGSLLQERRLEALSVQQSRLPDPVMSVGMANLPTDTFSLSQEPMTQLTLGIVQSFARGETLSLTQQKWQKLGSAETFARKQRLAELEREVTHLWLSIYRLERNVAIIEKDRSLFENMVDIVQSRYATASENTRQQDLVRAQLELTRLEDHLLSYRLESEVKQAQLAEWLGLRQSRLDLSHFKNNKLPRLNKHLYETVAAHPTALENALLRHPEIARIDKQIDASHTALNIAKESYKPKWQLQAQYGVRQNGQQGLERADFISIGVSMDLPFWTGNNQDKQVQAAAFEKESIKAHRQALLNRLYAGFYKADSAYQRLSERHELYEQRLLKEISEQAEASLSAYTTDDGDFSEVIRARIAELNASLEQLGIQVERAKQLVNINYFLTGIKEINTTSIEAPISKANKALTNANSFEDE